jgi:hypothetical protein
VGFLQRFGRIFFAGEDEVGRIRFGWGDFCSSGLLGEDSLGIESEERCLRIEFLD